MKNRSIQLDLLAAKPPTRVVDPDQRNKLLPLIEELLKEVAADALMARQEDGDDQNHA
jgi:hypothetical protein